MAAAAAGPSPACLRWRVNVGAWLPDDDGVDELLALLPPAEAVGVRTQRRERDRVRALACRLLVRAAVAECLGVDRGAATVRRTAKGGKPFVDAGGAAPPRRRPPNFNFNASHDGDWVALASHGTLLVGVDVAAPRPGPPRGARALRASFASCLAPSEWAAVDAAPDAASQDAVFRRHWACKEACAKARGDGVAADLASLEFASVGAAGDASPTLTLAGRPAHDWAFHLTQLPDGAALATAVGPPSAARDAGGTFLATLRARDLPPAELASALAQGLPPWRDVAVAELVQR